MQNNYSKCEIFVELHIQIAQTIGSFDVFEALYGADTTKHLTDCTCLASDVGPVLDIYCYAAFMGLV